MQKTITLIQTKTERNPRFPLTMDLQARIHNQLRLEAYRQKESNGTD